MFFIALHGTSNTKTLPAIFAWLKGKGVETVFNVFDMDKVTNVNVAKAGNAGMRNMHNRNSAN